MDSRSRRLEVRFRPEDAYSKPAYGDRNATCGFLLRVRVKKSRIRQAEAFTNETCLPSSSANSSTYAPQSSANNKGDNSKTSNNNAEPTYDPKKYQDLSQDAHYELPELKVLGRIETEFKFSSEFKNIYIFFLN